jgi:hypothetical protein
MLKHLLLILVFLRPCCFDSEASDSLILAVRSLIVAAHENNQENLNKFCDFDSVKKLPRHGMAKAELISLLRSIDPDKIEYVAIENIEKTGNSLVRIKGTNVNLDFDVQARVNEKTKATELVVVGVHP